MKTRAEIKLQAKEALTSRYGLSIGIYLLYSLIYSVASSFIVGAILIIPLVCGMSLVYLMLYKRENPSLDIMFTSAFQENYGRKLGGILLMTLYQILWTMLFIIPGIVKAYSYAMTPYILAKYTNVDANCAITLSRRIMDGRKADLFVVDLSFIGWQILNILTFGILGIFYVMPYMQLTKAGCFDEYLADALASGKITEADLGIVPEL